MCLNVTGCGTCLCGHATFQGHAGHVFVARSLLSFQQRWITCRGVVCEAAPTQRWERAKGCVAVLVKTRLSSQSYVRQRARWPLLPWRPKTGNANSSPNATVDQTRARKHIGDFCLYLGLVECQPGRVEPKLNVGYESGRQARPMEASPADQLQTPLLLFRLSLSSLAQQQSSALTLPNALIMFQSNLPQDAWKNWACPSPCCLLALIFGHTNTGIKYNTGDV